MEDATRAGDREIRYRAEKILAVIRQNDLNRRLTIFLASLETPEDRTLPSWTRFKAAFGRALPHLPKKELSWRLHFIMGALSYTLAGTDALKIISELNPLETDNDEILLRRLAPFLLAGLKAPLPELGDVSRAFDHEVERRT